MARTKNQERINSPSIRKAAFIEPMECAPVSKLADGPQWIYEIKLDGYRAIAIKSEGKVTLALEAAQVFQPAVSRCEEHGPRSDAMK